MHHLEGNKPSVPLFTADEWLMLQDGPRVEGEKSSTSINEAFGKLKADYQSHMDGKFASNKWSAILANKDIALSFLDKLNLLKGGYSKEKYHLNNFDFGVTTHASTKIEGYVAEASKRMELSEKERASIEQWKEDEEKFREKSYILDGLRDLPYLEKLLETGSNEGNMTLWDKIKLGLTPRFLKTATDILSNKIKKDIEELEPNQKIKLLVGTLDHEVRLVVTKKEDGNLLLEYYDTANVALSNGRFSSKATKGFGSIEAVVSPEWLENKIEGLVYNKLYARSIDPIQALLEIKPATNVKWSVIGGDIFNVGMIQKSKQESNSCPYQCIFAEFKHRFMLAEAEELSKQGYDPQQIAALGYARYKLLKCHMAEAALEEAKANPTAIDSDLLKYFEENVERRKEIFHLLEVAQDPSKYEALIISYKKSLAIFQGRPTDGSDNFHGSYYNIIPEPFSFSSLPNERFANLLYLNWRLSLSTKWSRLNAEDIKSLILPLFSAKEAPYILSKHITFLENLERMRTALENVDLSEPSLPVAFLKLFVSHPADIKEFITPYTPKTESQEQTEHLIINFILDYRKFHTKEENIKLINLCYKHNLISKKTYTQGLNAVANDAGKDTVFQKILGNIEAHKRFKNDRAT